MRAFRAIVSNAFRKSGAGGAKASFAAAVALSLAAAVVFGLILGAWAYTWRWYFAKPHTAQNVIVVNAPDTFRAYTLQTTSEEYEYVFIDHPYIFDVAEFSSLMKEYDSKLTIVFESDLSVLTFYPTSDLGYTDNRNTFKNDILNGYASYLVKMSGTPVAEKGAVQYTDYGLTSPESSYSTDPFLRSISFMLIPLLFFIAALYAAMTKGTNLIAGAKEQNSFAAILMTPVRREVIILGDITGIWLASMIPAALLSLILLLTPLREGVLATFLLVSVLSFFISSLVVLISVMSSNVITAQTAFLPVFLIFITLCITCMQNPEEYFGVYEYLPLYGQYLGIALSLLGEPNFGAYIVSSILTLLLSGVCVFVSVKLLGSERFTVSVMSASDREILKAQREVKRASQRKRHLESKTSIYGYTPKSTLNSVSFVISQIIRPLMVLSFFQLIAMIPPVLMTNGEYLTSIMNSLRSVNSVSGVLRSGANIISVLMSTPAFLISMALGYIMINTYYCLRVRLIERTPLSSGLGLPREKIVPRYLTGAAIGFGMMVASFGILCITGNIKVTGFGIAPSTIPLFLAYIFMWLFQGASEEIMFRGYMMPRIASRYGLIPAIALSSLLFCVFHGMNPGFSVLAFINLILISILYALIAYFTDNIWIVCAAHTFWNFTQGNLVGLEVSGNSGNVSLIHTELTSKASSLMTGGTFGPEGGLAVTIVTLIGIAAVLVIFRNKLPWGTKKD